MKWLTHYVPESGVLLLVGLIVSHVAWGLDEANMALGGGQIRQSDLTQLLFVHSSKAQAKRQASSRRLNLEVADPGTESTEKVKLAELAALFDSSIGGDRLDWFERNTYHVKRIQRIWLAHLRKVRMRKPLKKGMRIGNALLGFKPTISEAGSSVQQTPRIEEE